ncbi:MAG: DUF3014 domain-containing protein [Burkholderiaceae bacterium]|nr:DUF3014 domain-containing protein [Burkholderiaceae bacterium]
MATNRSRPATAGPPWWLLLLAAAGIAAGLYLWQMEPVPRLPSRSATPPSTAPSDGPVDGPVDRADLGAEPAAPPPPAPAEAEAGPKFPLPESASQYAGSLPAAEASDAPILDALLALASRERLAQFLNLQDYARRFVVTIDNLPRQLVPGQWSALRPVPGQLAVAGDHERITLQPENYARYDAFVKFAESLDPKAAAKVYLRFYPLLQEQFRALGYPHGHLNDRVVAAIDDMLTAPEVSGPIRLVQPRVQYRFDDPLLESLSAGRKVMIRVGPENAARLKKVLRALRAEIVR